MKEGGVNSVVSSAQSLETYFFNSFVLNVDLFDVNLLGRKFTWYHASGLSMSRIDRVFILDGWSRC